MSPLGDLRNNWVPYPCRTTFRLHRKVILAMAILGHFYLLTLEFCGACPPWSLQSPVNIFCTNLTSPNASPDQSPSYPPWSSPGPADNNIPWLSGTSYHSYLTHLWIACVIHLVITGRSNITNCVGSSFLISSEQIVGRHKSLLNCWKVPDLGRGKLKYK